MDSNFSSDLMAIREILGLSQRELTDEQCKHCLAATNLGMQYILTSEQAVAKTRLIERCYISANEREYFKKLRSDEAKLGDDKVKLARKQYRGQGLYIDEILV